MKEQLSEIKCSNCGVTMIKMETSFNYELDLSNSENPKFPISLIINLYRDYHCDICHSNFKLFIGRGVYHINE